MQNKRRNAFTEEINKVALSLNDDKRIQSFDLTETYVYGMSKDQANEKEEINPNKAGLFEVSFFYGGFIFQKKLI